MAEFNKGVEVATTAKGEALSTDLELDAAAAHSMEQEEKDSGQKEEESERLKIGHQCKEMT